MRDKILLLISCLLFLTLAAACGRRGDPVTIIPYEEVGVVKDLKAVKKDGDIYLSWKMPESKNFPRESIKGFVVFRAEVPEGTALGECKCQYMMLDFITPDGEAFEYQDEKALKGQTYAYKITVMDKEDRRGKDSNIALVKGVSPGLEESALNDSPGAPIGLKAVYTQKNIILTWDKVPGQEAKFYRVYRSEGEDFVFIGETVTSVYTDKKTSPSKKYYYRVSTVGKDEGPLSEEIEVMTETR